MSDYLKDMFIEVREKPVEVKSSIQNTIDEIMNLLKSDNIIREEFQAQGQLFQAKETFSYEAIPAPSVSELGWASLDSNDEGTQVKRQELEQYLQRIPGSDLRVKLKNVSRILNDPDYAKSLIGFGESQGEKIASTLAYLVFLKTLTTVITNFNASSAGFNFEAFLAVLLGGSQIPASGAKTIADLTAQGVPISLKLYNEKTLKAGGSYNDLIGDLIKPPYYMRYVVATKQLEGKDLERRGSISVYQYDLTSDNIVEILYRSSSGENSSLIRLPSSVINDRKNLKFKVPKLPTLDDIEETFNNMLSNEIGSEPWYPNLLQALDYQNNRKLYVKQKPGYQNFSVGQGGRSTRPSSSSPLLQLLTKFMEDNQVENVDPKQLFVLLYQVQNQAMTAYYEAVDKLNKIGQGLGSYATSAQSRNFFNTLTRAQKRKALMLTAGYRSYGNQYELRRNDIYTVDYLAGEYNVFGSGQKELKLGDIEIGRNNVQKVFNELIDDVNKTVFEIFEELSVLSKNLQGYFAGGLQDQTKANDAIRSSAMIGRKTEETKQIN
tara:strand:- start:194 stop:1840 length:1647 start_codon:yes stop_codon:yes gene_type:complete